MTNIICWECNQPSGLHKMGCGSKSRVEALHWLLNSLQSVPDETLETVVTSCKVELLERRLAWCESEYVFEESDDEPTTE